MIKNGGLIPFNVFFIDHFIIALQNYVKFPRHNIKLAMRTANSNFPCNINL